MNPKVSVIIPFYSNQLWLQEAIGSVLSQTYSNYEIIVINDGSKEDISKIEERFANQIKLIHQKNNGPGEARNNGIMHSTGKYIAFLDSDDIWLSDKLQEQINFMEENNFKWSHSDYIRFWNIRNREKKVKCSINGDIFPKCLIWNPIATPCVIVNRQILLDHSDLRFKLGKGIGEDSYMWWKIGEKYELGYFPRSLVKVRIHGKNSALRADLQLKVRGDLIGTIKNKKKKFRSLIIYYYYLITLYYCALSYTVLSFLIKRLKLNEKFSSLIYKVAYTFPYINFKIIKILICY